MSRNWKLLSLRVSVLVHVAEYEVTLCALCCVGSGNFLIQNTLEIFNFNIWRLSNLHCNRKISNMTLQFYLDFLFWRFSTHESRLISLKSRVIIIKVSKVSKVYFGFNLNNWWSLEQSRKQQHNNESNGRKYFRRFTKQLHYSMYPLVGFDYCL